MILGFAEADERIRMVTLEGSRTNRNIPSDEFQDYDITFFVTDMQGFTADDEWLNVFGVRLIMQKPEDMELFPAQERGFSYLMLFRDGVKIDLTLLPLDLAEEYFTWDKLVKILLDKDNRIEQPPEPTDVDYHLQRPTGRMFDDCCNEFWNTVPYVVKGLCRREILFAIDHMNDIVRKELLRMISWLVGSERGFDFSLGKIINFWTNIFRRRCGTGLWKPTEWVLMRRCGRAWSSAWRCSGKCRQRRRGGWVTHTRFMTKISAAMWSCRRRSTGSEPGAGSRSPAGSRALPGESLRGLLWAAL